MDFLPMDGLMLMFLLVMGFLAAFIDACVGGGGLISIPAFMCTGLPPLTVLGTNKVASVMGAFTSFTTFIRNGKVDVPLIRRLFGLSFAGSALGVFAVHMVPSGFLRPLIVVLLVLVAIYTVLKKDWGTENHYHGLTKRMLILSMCAAFTLGFHDGFFGPGTGSFLMFAFLTIGFDFIGAAANARALNFASNIAAAIFFTYSGLVDFGYAIPTGLSMIAGARTGARFAISHGTSVVKPLFLTVTAVMIGKQVIELLH